MTKMSHIPLATALMLALAAILACTGPEEPAADTRNTTPPSPTIDLSKVQEPAIKNLYDADGRMKNPHLVMQATVKDIDGGFGGYYFDPDNPTTAYVYMKDVSKTTEAETVFRSVYANNSRFTAIEVVPGAYTVDELTDWFYQAFTSVEAAYVTVLDASMNIMENEFQITVANETALATAWAVIDELGIPHGAVSLFVGRTTR